MKAEGRKYTKAEGRKYMKAEGRKYMKAESRKNMKAEGRVILQLSRQISIRAKQVWSCLTTFTNITAEVSCKNPEFKR